VKEAAAAAAAPLLLLPRPDLGGAAQCPDLPTLAAALAAAGVRNQVGQPLRLVPPAPGGPGYEENIGTTGAVETRAGNWHDACNALAWLAFPRAKAALNAAHRAARLPGERGPRRDALTHLDECGIVVLAEEEALLDLVRGFRWQELFWQRRTAVETRMRFLVLGHATADQLRAPFRGLTAKAVLYRVPSGLAALPPSKLFEEADRRLADDLRHGFPARPRELHPLPLLGIPGLVAANGDPAYYEDSFQFPAGRRGCFFSGGRRDC
jgi:hypothetical protein